MTVFRTRLSLVATIVLLLCAATYVRGGQSDPFEENRRLRTTNERLQRENEALRAEVAILQKKLADAEAVSIPASPPKKIVFIMDASGSMLNVFDHVREEVRRSIEELKPDQSFAVVLDREDANSPFPKALLPATDENKAKVLALFPKLFVRGSDNLVVSTKSALAMNPDLIWWRGDESQTPDALEQIKKMNVRKVKINTKDYADDPDHWFAWKLANDSGGTCFDKTGNPVVHAPPELPPPAAQQ